jgi:hypothetical protein
VATLHFTHLFSVLLRKKSIKRWDTPPMKVVPRRLKSIARCDINFVCTIVSPVFAVYLKLAGSLHLHRTGRWLVACIYIGQVVVVICVLGLLQMCTGLNATSHLIAGHAVKAVMYRQVPHNDTIIRDITYVRSWSKSCELMSKLSLCEGIPLAAFLCLPSYGTVFPAATARQER